MLEFEFAGETLLLTSTRAVYWPRFRTAVIADPHFGKAAAFRQAGIPIPHGTTEANLARLDEMLEESGAERLVVLGDFFHARTGRAAGTLQAMSAWRERNRELTIHLVRGNHDRPAGDPPANWQIDCQDQLELGPFLFAHDPERQSRRYVLAGHLHPAIRLHEACGPGLRAACFWFGARAGVLPAFGCFTGTHCIRPVPGDRVFVVGPEKVLEVPVVDRRRARAR